MRNFFAMPPGSAVITNTTQGILAPQPSFFNQTGYLPSDIEMFLAQEGVTTVSSAPAYVAKYLHAVGPNTSVRGETELDIESVMGLAPGAHTLMWTLVFGPGTPYTDFAQLFVSLFYNVSVGGHNPLAPWGLRGRPLRHWCKAGTASDEQHLPA